MWVLVPLVWVLSCEETQHLLTDAKVRSLKPSMSRQKVADHRGLSLWVEPSGTKTWYLRYRKPDKRQDQVRIGNYPEVTLSEARESAVKLRKVVAEGRDLKAQGRDDALGRSVTVESLAEEWVKHKAHWKNGHRISVEKRLRKWVLPSIGRASIGQLTPHFILDGCLRPIIDSGRLETAHRVKGYLSQMLRFAVATCRASRDVTADLRGAFPSVKAQHYPACLDAGELGLMLRSFDAYSGSSVVKAALQLTPLLFLRPGELRRLEWADVSDGFINIPGERMKMGVSHTFPLSSQATEILVQLRKLTGNERFVFPSARGGSRCLSENAVRAAIRSLGFLYAPHSFRATARTLLEEELGVHYDFIEHQRAHAVRDPNGRAYNRTNFIKQRSEMMQRWSDYLERLKSEWAG
jgi:integrase